MATHSNTPVVEINPVIMPMARAWFAVHTCSRHEKHVAQHFATRGIEHFLPLYEEVHRWGDRRATVQLPLFPGYLFARISGQARLQVLQVPGVARLVGFNGAPTSIDAAEIEALQRGICGGMRIEPHPYLKIGSRVLVCSGPMRGVEGVLVHKRDGMRVVISVDLIMRSVSVEIDPADLKVIS
jgi:transcription antitermination factor NusG